tara:strand:- start:11181 stop:12116 length:936 start_codon:yes stop_codon:yes gene_type:complete
VPAAIEIKNLQKSYEDTVALRGIDLTIEPGEFYGLLGPNGAGKTTTIGIITGLVKLESGSVSVFGKDIIRDYRFTRSKIGVSPQEFTSDWFFSIEKLLIFQAGYYGIPKNLAQPRVDEVMKKLGLYEKRDDKIRFLSGGMKRRFMIAKSLVNDPDILILDEPTAGVDVELRRMLWEYLQELHEKGKTILLTTHYIEEAEKLCGRVSIINDGKIATEGAPHELIRSLGKGSIEVQLTGWQASDGGKLNGLSFTYEPGEGDGRLSFSVDDPEKELPQVVELVSRNGCHIHEVKITKSNLEDVFVALTGREINK